MKLRIGSAKVLAVCGMLAVGIAMRSASASGEDIKRIMGENFQNVQKILVGLVTANYATIPADVGTIRDHVSSLLQSPPASIKGEDEKVMFNLYGTAVKNAATNLADVAQEVIRRDNEHKASADLRVDYLRVAAAEYYGIMVTGCVQCHNQFRRYIVRLK